MRLISLLFVVLLFSTPAVAQKAPLKFGDVAMEDMKMTSYDLDPGAEAVVLADFGESTIAYSQDAGFQVVFERTCRIKILTKEGLKHAEFQIPLWREDNGSDKEKVSTLKLMTYNLENGKIVETKVKNDSFFEEKVDKNRSLMKCAWTNVKEGSILDITYNVTSDFLFNFQDWTFQWTIPVRWSEYRANIPEYYTYQTYTQGYVPLTINQSSTKSKSITVMTEKAGNRLFAYNTGTATLDYREDIFRWAAKDVPAFKVEPHMTGYLHLISKLNFELAYTKFPNQDFKNYMGTWADITKTHWESVKSEIQGGGGIKNEVDALTSSATSDEQKAANIFDFVRRTVLWDGYSQRLPAETPRRVMDAKKGSSADINTLLACMLDKAGLKVYPVMLSTREHGFIRESIPVSSQFNYMICAVKIGEKTLLLDATDRTLPAGVLPERCLNGRGLLLSSQGPEWVNLSATIKTRTLYSADVSITPDGEVKGTCKIDKTGYASARARTKYLSKGETEYLKEFSQHPVFTFSNGKFENTDNVTLPFKELYEIAATDAITANGSYMYLNPFIVARIDENPFKSETRQYPVDFGNQFEDTYTVMIAVPEGYTVEELPPSKLLSLPENGGRYVYNLVKQGDKLSLTSTLVINKSIFSQEAYSSLREFYSQVVAKQSEQIVLKKK